MTSQLFKPTKKDQQRVSVDNGDMISAEESYRGFTERFESVGVLAVSVAECEAQAVRVVPDGLEDRPAHTAIDFSGLSVGKVKKVAEHLRDDAVRRGWQYRPSTAS